VHFCDAIYYLLFFLPSISIRKADIDENTEYILIYAICPLSGQGSEQKGAGNTSYQGNIVM